MENESMSIEERIAEEVEYLQQCRKRGMYIWEQETSGGVLDMARGGDAGGTRQRHYQGWTDENFKQLWIAMGEDPDEI